ncbi:hypothetical protein BC830DRAFT_183742 [Chytriomyces sp. MP71]|nr:hypothetical protein BC830DRAFT_183742 [Chytriomyces sp. MP71]
MDQSASIAVAAAFVLGAGIAAAVAVAMNRGSGSGSGSDIRNKVVSQTGEPNSNSASGSTGKSKKKKKNKKNADADADREGEVGEVMGGISGSSSSRKAAHRKENGDEEEVAAAVPMPVQQQQLPASSSRNTANNTNKQPKKNSANAPINNQEFPSLPVPASSAPKKQKKPAPGTSFAFVAATGSAPDAPPQLAHESQKKGYMVAAKPTAYVAPTASKNSISQTATLQKQPQELNVSKLIGMDSSEEEEEEQDSGPHARVLKMRDNEILEDGWSVAAAKKPPTLRLVSSSNSTTTSSYPVRPAPIPQDSLTRTQLKNQRKAEKAKEEKEAMRLLQEARKREYQRDVATQQSRDRAIAAQMSKGAMAEKQRLAAAAVAASARKNQGSEGSDQWTADSFWD